jgi:hypothetical protein
VTEEQASLFDLSVSCLFLGEEQPGLVDELLRFFSPEFVKETVLGHVVKESPIAPANGLQDGLNIRKHRLALEVLLSGNHRVRTAKIGAHEFQKSQKAVDCFANSRVDYENI